MKGYVVCVYKSIRNQEKLKEYAVKARVAVEKYKGKFLIRGGKSAIKEGDKSPRTVVIEFSSFDLKWWWCVVKVMLSWFIQPLRAFRRARIANLEFGTRDCERQGLSANIICCNQVANFH